MFKETKALIKRFFQFMSKPMPLTTLNLELLFFGIFANSSM